MFGAAYAFIPITFIILLGYLITYLLYKHNILKKSGHRRIWNIVLLLSFLVSGLLGIFLVIQINYKLPVEFIDVILQYHVDFGIALFITAILHISWHLKYFSQMIRGHTKEQFLQPAGRKSQAFTFPEKLKGKEGSLFIPVFLLGFTTLTAQVILLREFLSVFSGNELIVGIILTNWMLITALGAALGKHIRGMTQSFKLVPRLFIIITVLPIITVFLINFLKNIVFPLGTETGIYQVFFSSLVLLMPLCLISGLFFSFMANYISSAHGKNFINRVYATEAIGSIAGGVLVNIVLLLIFGSFKSLAIILIINFTGLSYLYFTINQKNTASAMLTGTAVGIALLMLPVDKWMKHFLYPNQEIMLTKDTPYGNMTITKKLDQLNFYLNNVLLFDTQNLMDNEESVHFGMVQHPDPDKVLLISGGISGRIKEIKKYHPSLIDYVEFNPWIVSYGKKYFHPRLEDDTVNVIIDDPRRFLRKTNQTYDVVMVNISDPDNAQLNRFYTLEFFKKIKSVIGENGILSLSLRGIANYISEDMSDYQSITYNTLKAVFTHVEIIPGEKNYFIASDSPITNQVISQVSKKNVNNQYVNPYYFNERLLEQKSNKIKNSLNANAGVNKDFHPVSYIQKVKIWLNEYSGSFWIMAVSLIIVLLVFIMRSNPYSMGILTAGFTVSSMEVIMILIIQIIYGNLYYMTGVVFTVFMAGLSIGSIKRDQIIKTPRLAKMSQIQLGLGLLVLTVPLINYLFRHYEIFDAAIFPAFFIIIFFLGLLTGLEFSIGSYLMSGSYAKISGNLYGADLFGSAVGALIVSIYLIPLLGLNHVIFAVSIMNFFCAFYIFTQRKAEVDNG